ncbi:MAG: DNA-binding protein [Firmicutes bacterium HGW-Firmicutes-8]|nr:MAG: DNA-binding protein [Firmicutes bacterium HGW-Firmicutes-8]
MEQLFNIEEVAEILGVKAETVRTWLRSGKIKGTKLGKLWRVKESELQKFIKKCNGK